jgi:hypothetical protein
MTKSALAKISPILDDSVAQSVLESWIMQRASTHRYNIPKALATSTASRNVRGRSKYGIPFFLCSKVLHVVVSGNESPQQ